MGNKLVKYLDSSGYNRKLFFLDGGIEDLPEIIGKNDILPGSECHSLTSTDKFVLNTRFEWVQVREPIQKYLGDLEEKFFTFFNNLVEEIKAQGIDNKRAINDLEAATTLMLTSIKTSIDTQGAENKLALDNLTNALNANLAQVNAKLDTLNSNIDDQAQILLLRN